MTDEISDYDSLSNIINEVFNPPPPNKDDFEISDDDYKNIYFINKNDKKENNSPGILNKKNSELKSEESLAMISTLTKTSTLPKFYSLDNIIRHIHNETITDKLNEGRSIEKSIGYGFVSELIKKKKRKNENINLFIGEKKIVGNKRGRKTEDCLEEEPKVHTKMAPDNITKKIKGILFNYLLKFLNTLLNKINSKIKLVKIKGKYLEKMGRAIEIELLSSPLIDILSSEISTKFKNIKKEYNKNAIEAIIKSEIMLNEKNDFNYDTLMFVLNISFRNWLDIFTGKDNIENIAKNYIDDQTKINFKLIKESFVGINTLLSDFEKKNKNDNNYFALFVFYLYNYERYFFLKSTRKKIKKLKKVK